VKGLIALREDSKADPDDPRAWFDRQLHSSFSIKDRLEKEANKGIKKEDEF
jgi:hypothetical protein